MVTDEIETMASDQLRLLLIALRGMTTAVQDELTERGEVLAEYEQEEQEWDRFMNDPQFQAFLEKLTEETEADIAAGRTKKWRATRGDLLHS
jgi:hypothetical protein